MLSEILIVIVGAFVPAFLVVDPKGLSFESPAVETEINDMLKMDWRRVPTGQMGKRWVLFGSREKSDLKLKAAADLELKQAIGFLEA